MKAIVNASAHVFRSFTLFAGKRGSGEGIEVSDLFSRALEIQRMNRERQAILQVTDA